MAIKPKFFFNILLISMLNSLINLPPELQLEALKIIARTEGLSGLKGICETNQYLSDLCRINKHILIKESDKPRLSKLFTYIEQHGAEGLQDMETGGFCERNKEIINQKIDEYLEQNPQQHANLFEIRVELSESEFDQDMDFIISDSLQEAFDKWPYRHFMRRGDILFNSIYPRYRNDGKCLFDGEQLIGLDSEFNEYGHVSKEFLAFTEFPPNYWDNLAYNGYNVAWVDFSQLNIINSYDDNHYDKLYICHEVEFSGKNYCIMTEPGEDIPEGRVLIYNDGDEHHESDYFVETFN
jgi:hypothetical protein